MIKLLQQIWDLLFTLNPVVTLLTAGMSLAIAMFQFWNQVWGAFATKLAMLTLPEQLVAPVLEGYAFLDYFLPVHEIFGYLAVYVSVIGLCTLIRIIKSFLPTIN